MGSTFSDIGLIFLFILIGGVFAAAEMALVSLRESQVRQLSTRGKRGETVAALAADPNRFLASAQVGGTLATILSGAFGGATLSNDLTPILVEWGIPEALAGPVSLMVITVLISYASVVLSELTAKRLAMQRAESFAMALAPMVNVISKIAKPVIWFLGVSTNVVVRILGATRRRQAGCHRRGTAGVVVASTTLGDAEREIVDEVFSAGRSAYGRRWCPGPRCVPRRDMPAYKAIRAVSEGFYSRYPVIGRDVDDVIGFVHLRIC